MRFAVSNNDIDSGRVSSRYACPVALAIKRRMPKGTCVEVQTFWCSINGHSYDLPSRISQFIRSFDGEYTVNPTWFDLDLKA